MRQSNAEIRKMLSDITPEQLLSLMAEIKGNGVRKIDTSVRERRNQKTALYFSVAPLPYKSTYEEYKMHSDSIREQVISGVDL
jgi:CMP-2-keto-3-deoxyoctulosonic acid synthetase|tara:strand:+ start:1427 stop:1675 length:249 start_codon:yes stop_codon:yes gene_type:complete